MPTNQDIELENEFLRLLKEADPELSERDPVVREFASQLATLTDDWATGSPMLQVREEALDQWIRDSTDQHVEFATFAGSELEMSDEESAVEADASADA